MARGFAGRPPSRPEAVSCRADVRLISTAFFRPAAVASVAARQCACRRSGSPVLPFSAAPNLVTHSSTGMLQWSERGTWWAP